jgi:uncharacterized protein (DUF952 family)
MIYHITTIKDWETALRNGRYEIDSLMAEGFIHASQEHQVPDVISRYYSGRSDLVKLVIDPEKLNSQLIHEWSPSLQDTFPHIYGPINLDAVVEVVDIQ